MTATEGALLAMKETGRVIVGVVADNDPLPDGYILFKFAGHSLRDHRLYVTGRAARKDWDAQVRLFGLVDPTKRTKGQKFYTAVLVELPK